MSLTWSFHSSGEAQECVYMVLSAYLEIQSFFRAFYIEKTNKFINLDRPTIWKLKAQKGGGKIGRKKQMGNYADQHKIQGPCYTAQQTWRKSECVQEASGRRREGGMEEAEEAGEGRRRGRILNSAQSKWLTLTEGRGSSNRLHE